MLVSDTIKRFYLSHPIPEFTENSLMRYAHFLLLSLPISKVSLKQSQVQTKSDPILQTLITYINHKWPEKHLIPTDSHLYYTHRGDTNFCEGILLKNERIITHYPSSRN